MCKYSNKEEEVTVLAIKIIHLVLSYFTLFSDMIGQQIDSKLCIWRVLIL
jgi:hypothetical protein